MEQHGRDPSVEQVHKVRNNYRMMGGIKMSELSKIFISGPCLKHGSYSSSGEVDEAHLSRRR